MGEQNIISVKIEFDGKASEINSSSILSSVFCGIFKSHIDTVNIINSIQIAKQKGLEISTINHDRKCDYQNLITVTVNYESKSRKISGTLIGGKIPRITEVQGIPIEANFFTNMIYVRNYDKPGFIGSIGTLLAENDINIASFHLGRREKSGEAIALVEIDQIIEEKVLDKIKNLSQVVRANVINFK